MFRKKNVLYIINIPPRIALMFTVINAEHISVFSKLNKTNFVRIIKMDNRVNVHTEYSD